MHLESRIVELTGGASEWLDWGREEWLERFVYQTSFFVNLRGCATDVEGQLLFWLSLPTA